MRKFFISKSFCSDVTKTFSVINFITGFWKRNTRVGNFDHKSKVFKQPQQ